MEYILPIHRLNLKQASYRNKQKQRILTYDKNCLQHLFIHHPIISLSDQQIHPLKLSLLVLHLSALHLSCTQKAICLAGTS